jgi:hypothetical protein
MLNEGIVLGHKISERGIEVDTAKVEAIEKMPCPRDVKGIRSILGHAGFYRRIIKDFSKISKPLTNLLQKDVPPDWNLPFEIMCDTSDFAVGDVLGQRVNAAWCSCKSPSSWEPQEEGMMSTVANFPSERNQGLSVQ